MKNLKNLIKIILGFSTLYSVNVFAWGAMAHKSIGLIAMSMLTPQAQWATHNILNNETLADVSTWPDEIRGKKGAYQQTSSYHYEGVRDGETYLDSLRRLSPQDQQKGGVVTAILVAIAYSRDPNTPPQERYEALKFLVHFIGDVHQPLHSGRPEDLGGNKIKFTWFGNPTNLHALWDTGILNTGHHDIINPNSSPEESSQVYARYLYETQRGYVFPLEINVEGWVNESLNYRPQVYNGPFETDQVGYLRSNLAFADFRVYQAGVRLASVLNQIYGQAPIEYYEQTLWQQVQEIVGPLFNLISFKP